LGDKDFFEKAQIINKEHQNFFVSKYDLSIKKIKTKKDESAFFKKRENQMLNDLVDTMYKY
jgi:hypothetical protein